MLEPCWVICSGGPRQRLARGHAQLRLHEVEPGHLLGDRVLHLQPGVHLEEVELVAQDDELHRPRVDVAHGAGPGHRGLGQARLQGRGQARRRALLDQLLVPALDRALALVEMDHAPGRVAEHLDLDVARALDVALQEEPARAERGLGPSLGRGERGGQPRLVRDLHHADAAAPRGRLQHDRIAGAGGHLARRLDRLHRPVAAGHHRHPGRRHEPARADLVPHLLDHPPGRPHEDQARGLAGLGEAPVLGEEPVAGMDRLGLRPPGRVEDPLDVEVALAGGRGPDGDRLVGVGDVRPRRVGFRVHRDRADAERAARRG